MIFDNARYLSVLVKRAYLALLLALAGVLALAIFFALSWYRDSKLDNVYILSSDATMTASRTDGSLARSDYEIMAFSKLFLEKAFAHHEYTWEENMAQVTDLMDKESALFFLSNMNENIEALYKERNAISTVSLKDIEINRDTHPFEVLLYYTSSIRFPSLGEVVFKNQEIEGGLYFQIEPLSRSMKNPYGMQVRQLKFLQKPSGK